MPMLKIHGSQSSTVFHILFFFQLVCRFVFRRYLAKSRPISAREIRREKKAKKFNSILPLNSINRLWNNHGYETYFTVHLISEDFCMTFFFYIIYLFVCSVVCIGINIYQYEMFAMAMHQSQKRERKNNNE